MGKITRSYVHEEIIDVAVLKISSVTAKDFSGMQKLEEKCK